MTTFPDWHARRYDVNVEISEQAYRHTGLKYGYELLLDEVERQTGAAQGSVDIRQLSVGVHRNRNRHSWELRTKGLLMVEALPQCRCRHVRAQHSWAREEDYHCTVCGCVGWLPKGPPDPEPEPQPREPDPALLWNRFMGRPDE